MGLVTGVIGCLQALEAIKIILNYKIKEGYSNETSNLPIMSGTMLLFDAISCRFRNVKLRPRREEANQVLVHSFLGGSRSPVLKIFLQSFTDLFYNHLIF